MSDPKRNVVILAYKNLGETPLACLKRARLESIIESDVPMTYAGRLDPMAEGLMILLVGEECKKKEKYLNLNKTYEFQILVGFKTDTHDLLGLTSPESKNSSRSNPLYGGFDADSEFIDSESVLFIKNILPQFIGTSIQKYPRFSSKTSLGKQLFQLAKDGNLPDELPEHEVTISDLYCTSTMILKKNELEAEILRRLTLVHGDFRQKEIIERWKEVLAQSKEKEFTIISCVAKCSSGTYIRQLVSDISEKVGIPLVTYSIKRNKIGEYSTASSNGLS